VLAALKKRLEIVLKVVDCIGQEAAVARPGELVQVDYCKCHTGLRVAASKGQTPPAFGAPCLVGYDLVTGRDSWTGWQAAGANMAGGDPAPLGRGLHSPGGRS
jgi:hypothetical protein